MDFGVSDACRTGTRSRLWLERVGREDRGCPPRAEDFGLRASVTSSELPGVGKPSPAARALTVMSVD
jgi:hypothetical protein